MERYLEGEELAVDEVAHALKDAVTRGEIFPVACGVATKNLGTHGAARPARRGRAVAGEEGAPVQVEGAGTAAFVFKTIADPFAGRITLFRVLQGTLKADSTVANARTHVEGAPRAAPAPPGQGAHARRTSSARATSAPSRS